VPSSIQNQLRKEGYSPKWREAVRSFYVRIEAQPIGDEIALKLLEFMKKNMPAIRHLVDRADQLARELQGQMSNFVLCHSDMAVMSW
jgi:spectinomycin phosphotransferase